MRLSLQKESSASEYFRRLFNPLQWVFASDSARDELGRMGTIAVLLALAGYFVIEIAQQATDPCAHAVWQPSRPGCPTAAPLIPPERMIGNSFSRNRIRKLTLGETVDERARRLADP